MRKIVFSKPFLAAWGAWHLAWFAGLFWVSWANPDLFRAWMATLYTVFVPTEGYGVHRQKKTGDGLSRTLSHVRQYLPVTLGRGRDAVGWKALAYSGVVDGVIVGIIVYPVSPLLAAVLSIACAMWLVPHFGWPERTG